jgi:hypothetical protein
MISLPILAEDTTPPAASVPAMPSAPAAAVSPVVSRLPAPGTEVVVKTLELMMSKTAVTGQHFPVEVSKDVVENGQVLVPAGTRGSGTIIFARKRGSGGRSGALDVRIDYLELPTGRLKVKAGDNLRGAGRLNGAMTAQVMFGIIGALTVHGDDISMPAGTEILAVVSTQPAIQSSPAVAPAVIPETTANPENTTKEARQ